MKKAVISLGTALILTFIAAPLAVDAAWWNPFSWKKAQTEQVSDQGEQNMGAANLLSATSTDSENAEKYTTPSTEELLRRIAELEDKLAKALEKVKTTTAAKEEIKVVEKSAASATQATPSTSSVSSGLSQSEISSKVKPAVVYIDTASSSSAGVFIDGQGRILAGAYLGLIEPHATATITMSNGTKKPAYIVGFDESSGLAVLELSTKNSPAYVKLNHDAGVAIGDKVYVVGWDSIVPGTITVKTTNTIEVSTESKPSDIGGAVVNASGALIGLPNPSSCKVLEEMKTCLKYTLKVNTNAKTRLSKILAGMKLYRDKKNGTAAEELIGGKLDGVYLSTSPFGIIDSAVDSVTGKNSFDYFNSKLSEDENYKITKIYLNKLKIAADNIYKSYEFLRSQSSDLFVFLENEEFAITTLEDYQKKILSGIKVYNEAKFKEYEAKVTLWSKKKKEYDGYIADPSKSSYDYLMEQGVVIETAAEALKAEKKKVVEMFSGENIEIF